MDWTSNRMIAVYLAAGVLLALGIAVLAMRKAMRTRIRSEREVRDDPDIHDWLVVFDWSRKALYVPTMGVSAIAALMMLLHETDLLPPIITPGMIGGVWFAVFFLNFLVEEFDLSVKVLVIAVLALVLAGLWLHLVGWLSGVLGLFRHLSVSISSLGFFLIAVLGALTLGLSWLRGLFHYVVFTPNFMNVQWGLTEAGDHIGREDYNTHVDTTDILERLMGFGRIVITFRDRSRTPMVLLAWNIGKVASRLESVRGKFAIDMNASGGTVLAPRPARDQEPVEEEIGPAPAAPPEASSEPDPGPPGEAENGPETPPGT